jgi:iron(III) transport system substrate-binding protein
MSISSQTWLRSARWVLGAAILLSAHASTTAFPSFAAENWQQKWEDIVKGAKSEGKVVVYGPAMNDLRDLLTRKFKDRYQVSVEYLGATGPEVAGKIDAERRGGIYVPDALIGASSPVVTHLKPSGFMDPIERVLILPEVIDPAGWWNNQFPWVDKGHYSVAFGIAIDPPLLINTELVKPEEVKHLRALLDPKWKGKIVMFDPTVYGPGQWFVASQAELTGVEFLRQLASQEPILSRDRRLISEWVGRGKNPIAIAPGEAAQDLINAGAPIQYAQLADTTHAGASIGFLSLPSKAPHPNASTLFINWFLSKEGQAVYQEATRQPSTRKDISTGALNQAFVLKEGVKYYPCYTEEFLMKGKEQIDLGKEIFGQLLK